MKDTAYRDCSMVCFDNVFCQGQSDACSGIFFLSFLVFSLEEAFKDSLFLVFWDTGSAVCRLYDQLISLDTGFQADASSVRGIFESIGKKVEEYLFHLSPVYPAQNIFRLRFKGIIYLALLGIVGKGEINFFKHQADVLGCQMQDHMILGEFTEVKEFRYKVSHVLGVLFDLQQLVV